MDPHNIHKNLYDAEHAMPDPGNGGTIRVTEDLQILEMVSAGAETRTIAAPTKPGLRFVLRLMTDGGDVVVTAAEGLNPDGDTVATFADASDILQLMSVSTATGFRWEVTEGNVGVSIAA